LDEKKRLLDTRAADDAIVNTMLSAPAKINLTLEVLAKRSDGFHALRSVVVPIEYIDELSWSAQQHFSFTCSDAALSNEENLVVKAAKAIELDRASFALHLEKHIPYGSGLGGGSSDAAAVLIAAMQGAFGPQPDRDWVALARSIGSDVPLFLVDAPALIEATGERVTALGANPNWWVVMLFPDIHISTSQAYAELDAAQTRSAAASRNTSVSIHMIEALQRREFLRVCELLSNDFEQIVFAHPAFAPAIDVFSRAQQKAHLSGSGSTLFALCEQQADAEQLAHRFRADHFVAEQKLRVHAAPFRQSKSWRTEDYV